MQPLIDIPSTSEDAEQIDDHTLVLTAFYDHSNRLVEINMNNFRYQSVPRVLMQLIALIVPYNRQLTKFTIKRCRINMHTIYELSKILLITNITDVCLDQSPVREGNYDILLSDDASCIRNISLSRCNINDIVCERIAARLRHREPAEKTLLVLNLSSNHITDVGVKQLGEALRTNRHLRYLNIADNSISDVGARYIFDVLTEFNLSCEEVMGKRHRYIKYIKKKQILFYKCVRHLTGTSDDNGSNKKSKKGTSGKNKMTMKRDKTKESPVGSMSDECITVKAEMMAADLMGPFEDPFSPSTVNVKDGCTYSVGNLTLCYLNMAYNNLTYLSVQRLLAVILHQQTYTNSRLCGLLNVVIEGNYIPSNCTELKTLNTELLKRMMLFGSRMNGVDKKSVLSSRN